MCGGFTCSKNSLIALNVSYMIVSVILISVAAYAKAASVITSISLVSGIIACGVFLLFLSVIGLIGASKHHQGWRVADDDLKEDTQMFFGCCGYNDTKLPSNDSLGHPSCDKVKMSDGGMCCSENDINNGSCCNENSTSACLCDACDERMQQAIARGLSAVGGIGLFFSFTEILGVWIAGRYRSQFDPLADVYTLT